MKPNPYKNCTTFWSFCLDFTEIKNESDAEKRFISFWDHYYKKVCLICLGRRGEIKVRNRFKIKRTACQWECFFLFYQSMLQKLGKIKVGHFFLREYISRVAMGVKNLCSLLTGYTTLFGRVCNDYSHDFKFAETSSKFHKILQYDFPVTDQSLLETRHILYWSDIQTVYMQT